MRFSIADAGLHPVLVRLSYLVLVGLASCAKANPPEMFVADPALQDDYHDSLPATGSSGGFEYAIIQGIAVYEGDILLGRVDSNGSLADRFQARGVGKNDAFNRWPDGIIAYASTERSSPIQQANIEEAMAHWTEHTTLTFVERTPENSDKYPHYIKFMDTQSCASHVGMIGGEQPIYLSDACSIGSVIHEIGHAVGLFHEHTRPDRDNFVQIDWNEIVNGKDINFNLQTANVDTYSPYDYGSIMHYGRDFFSKSGGPTIIVADGIEIGQREALSPLDIQSANKMYETDLALATPVMTPSDEGLEIDIAAYNYGTLGAHDIELILRMGDDSEWKGVSMDSGWLCLALGPELNCTIDTFREQTESRFTVMVDPNSASEDDLSASLRSRTQDSDLSNNGYNDEGVVWESESEELTTGIPEIQNFGSNSSPLPENNEPDQPAAAQSRNSESTVASASNDAGGGGSMPLSMLALLAIFVGVRRRRV